MTDADKSELNPYESPAVAEPVTKAQRFKRSAGVAVILIATPPALLIATVLSCGAAGYPSASGFEGIIWFGGPFLTLTGLMASAAVLNWPRKGESPTLPWRTAVLILTPIVFAVAAAIGFGLSFAFMDGIRSLEIAIVVGIAFLFGIPVATLFAMLWLAWRANVRNQ